MAYGMNILSLSLIRPSPRKTTEGPATFSQPMLGEPVPERSDGRMG
jgi:hypothetical protein